MNALPRRIFGFGQNFKQFIIRQKEETREVQTLLLQILVQTLQQKQEKRLHGVVLNTNEDTG